MGLIGSFQGYVDSPLYLYNDGSWKNLQTTGTTPTTTRTYSGEYMFGSRGPVSIYVGHDANNQFIDKFCTARLNQTVNLTGYNYIKSYCGMGEYTNREIVGIGVSTNASVTSQGEFNKYAERIVSGDNMGTVTLDVSSLNGSCYIYLYIRTNSSGLGDYIRLSRFDTLFLTTV